MRAGPFAGYQAEQISIIEGEVFVDGQPYRQSLRAHAARARLRGALVALAVQAQTVLLVPLRPREVA